MPNTPVPAAAEGLPGFYLHIGSEPPESDAPLIIDLRSIQPTARRALEETVELLIAALDELEVDPDLEPSTSALTLGYGPSGVLDECEDAGEDEPSLGWTASNAQGGPGWLADDDDREEEHDGAELDVDGEPWLGSIEVGIEWGETWEGVQSYVRVGIDQRDWGLSGDRDLEAEHDGREPQGDEEPEEQDMDEGCFMHAV